MSTPFQRSVVVIHGVGDQAEEDSVQDLSRALARALQPDVGWPPPIRIVKNAELRCDAREGSEAESFTVTEMKSPRLDRVGKRLAGFLFMSSTGPT